MATIIFRNARVVSPSHVPGKDVKIPRRGELANALAITPSADVTVKDGLIESIKPIKPDTRPRKPAPGATEIDANGRVLMPGFVDCHTHACWAGSRIDEWDLKRRGVSYLDILKRGGGIMATVRAVRAASEQQLTDLLLERLQLLLRYGTTTVEVKSGYGLTTADELKMLHAIARAAAHWPGTIRPTALLGHAIDEEQPGFVGLTVRQTLPAVAAEFPPASGLSIDAYCERAAWSLEQCVLLFGRAHELGYPIRVHADQFNSFGMVPAAVRMDAVSVDHLEVTNDADLDLLAKSQTYGVMLPAAPYHLGGPQGKARKFVQDGGALCLATNYNPGSAPCGSMPEVVSLAVRAMHISPAEAITATTINPALLLNLPDRGVVEVGKRADLLLLRHTDERGLAFEFGTSPIAHVMCNGKLVV